MDADVKLMEQLKLDEAQLRYHHAVFWDEIRHYTWVLSLLVGVPIVLVFQVEPHGWQSNLALAFIFSLGAVMSLIAFFVTRRESVFFIRKRYDVIRLEQSLALHRAGSPELPEDPQDFVRAYDVQPIVKMPSRNPRTWRLGDWRVWKWTIRSLHVHLFLIYLLASLSATSASFTRIFWEP